MLIFFCWRWRNRDSKYGEAAEAKEESLERGEEEEVVEVAWVASMVVVAVEVLMSSGYDSFCQARVTQAAQGR
jgi:hypothetical protein